LARYLQQVDMERLVSLCKRRGFIFPNSEIYGGLGSTWDYGPLGAELKRHLRERWWRDYVYARDDIVGLDSAILMHPRVWEASGHLESFTDPLVECKRCHTRHRSDHLQDGRCPECGGTEFTEPRMFNLMFKTFLGPVEDTAHTVYLRPETAQGIFVNFLNVLNASRKKLPFGIAQVGKSFRNEITPGNFTFRTREFEQMEIEYFVRPGTDEEWHRYWVEERFQWYLRLGIRRENLRIRHHEPEELAHYAKATADIEYRFPWGWAELEGIANRTDYDLRRHSEFSGEHLLYYDDERKEHYYPYVIEPSGGVDRAALAFLVDAYDEEPERGETRVVLRLHPWLAPIKCAVLPLSRNPQLVPLARRLYDDLRREGARRGWLIAYDDSQSIGRRYRRQDEVGTPWCITVDFQSLEDRQVTVRDRDRMAQVRVPMDRVAELLQNLLDHGWETATEPWPLVTPGKEVGEVTE